MRTVTLIDAIREAYQEELRRDESVFMVGQDIRGAIFPHTKGLVDEFGPDRILDTPISESGMYGAAFGAAQEGFRPIVGLDVVADRGEVTGDAAVTAAGVA